MDDGNSLEDFYGHGICKENVRLIEWLKPLQKTMVRKNLVFSDESSSKRDRVVYVIPSETILLYFSR